VEAVGAGQTVAAESTQTRCLVVASVARLGGPTGVQAYMRTVLDALTERGVAREFASPFQLSRVIVVGVFAWGPILRMFNTTAFVWWYRFGHRLLLWRRLRASVRRSRRTLIYAQDPLSAQAALDLRRDGYQVEVVLAVHFNVSEADEWAERGYIRREGRVFRQIRAQEAAVLQAVDRLVYPSEFMRDLVGSRLPAVRSVPSWCIPNFAADCDRESDEDAPVGDLISIGTLETRKNQEFLLRVLAECHAQGHRYRLTLVGDGPLRGRLQRMARALGLESFVTFAGHVPGAASLIHRYRALVHAAVVENLPIALLEALAAGRPIFAAPVGGIPEVFRDGIEGRYWSLGDARQAAALLVAVLEDEVTWSRLGHAARQRYEARFAPDEVVPRLLHALFGEPDGQRS
jgi:glycosyltransferase involved in cell wall biosynthesis